MSDDAGSGDRLQVQVILPAPDTCSKSYVQALVNHNSAFYTLPNAALNINVDSTKMAFIVMHQLQIAVCRPSLPCITIM